MTSRAPRPIPPDLPVELAVPVLDAIALTALERRLRDAATTVDGIRAGLRRVELREWRGSAADAFRDRLEEWVTTLHRRRDALDEAADLVAEHRRAAFRCAAVLAIPGGTTVTSYYDWSTAAPEWKKVFPVISESALKGTLGILDRTVRRRARHGVAGGSGGGA